MSFSQRRMRLLADGVVVRHGRAIALDGVSLALRAGELVALVGPNGSGKSTLLRALLGAQPIDAGVVALDGEPIAAVPPRRRARTLTMVTHGAPLDFALRARDLVALGRIPHEAPFAGETRDDEDAIADAMARTGVSHLADRAVDTLSAGELQRVQLARAFAQRAAIVLLDEPTANLDPRHQLDAMRALRAFADRGGAVLLAIHDLTLAARAADRVVVLDRGRVRADGAPRAALDEATMAAVFGVRVRIARDAGGAIDHLLALEPLAPHEGGPT